MLEVAHLDGRSVPTSDLDEAVTTWLCTQSLPIIRHRADDMARTSRGACRVGRGLHIDQQRAAPMDIIMGSASSSCTH